MKCSECRHDNPVDSLFCEECGSSFALACAACQKENNRAAKFCRFCGEAIEANSSPSVEPSDSEVADDGQTSTQIMSETIASANDESPLAVSSTEEIFQESSSEEAKEADVPTVAPVGFGEAISRGFSNYFVFKGRASRREYWWWVLFTVLVSFIPFGGFVTFIPSLAVSVRRLHDKGESAEKFIWMCAFQFGPLCLMVLGVFSSPYWFALAIPVLIAVWSWWAAEMSDDGQKGTNEYGPDPRSTPRF